MIDINAKATLTGDIGFCILNGIKSSSRTLSFMMNLQIIGTLSVFLVVGMPCFTIGFNQGPSWRFPWDECTSMDQIVGDKCDIRYYICDFGDSWFTREVLCNNCIGDCPPGRVFDNSTETCVWPNTIGCGCTEEGQRLGDKCAYTFFVCTLLPNNDWTTQEIPCGVGTVYNPATGLCQTPLSIGCSATNF